MNIELCVQLNQDIQMRNNEAQREFRKKDKLERELRQNQADLDTKVSEVKSLGRQIDKLRSENAKAEQALKEQRVWINEYYSLTTIKRTFKPFLLWH